MANVKPRKRGRQPAHSESEKPIDTNLHPPIPKSPADQPVTALRRYIKRYDIPIASPMTFPGFLLHGPVGKRTKSGKQSNRISRDHAISAVSEHLKAGVIKEIDAISEFLYTIEHKNKEFKLHLGESPREKDADESGVAPTSV